MSTREHPGESTLCSGLSYFFSFHHLGPVEAGPKLFRRILPGRRAIGEDALGLKKWWRRKGATLVQQTGPHSPICASPSLLGQVEVGTVQSVSVCIPPPTRWISSSFKERAPVRTNTLFLSFMFFSFRHFGSLNLTQRLRKRISSPCQAEG